MSTEARKAIKEILMDPLLFDGGYIDVVVDRIMDVQKNEIATLVEERYELISTINHLAGGPCQGLLAHGKRMKASKNER